jgi:predicted GH43/DUF377 family glycosyl hydrolase
MSINVIRRPENLVPDDKRVIARYFYLPRHRIKSILARLMKLSDRQVTKILPKTIQNFAARHRDIRATFLDHYEAVAGYLDPRSELSGQRKLLIGAYFTMEYSIESAALFNPSIVPHPDQSNLPEGAMRFLMSLRATGEGHLSSIVFEGGLAWTSGKIEFDPPPRYAYCARAIPQELFGKQVFYERIMNLGISEELAKLILEKLPENFSYEDLQRVVEQNNQSPDTLKALKTVAADVLWSARACYDLHYPPDCLPSEIVIFPATEPEQRGMEDLRLVRFVGDDGLARYYGTYTAYDGARIHPMLIETDDFTNFHVAPLRGRYARNKGFALFPRMVGGKYCMISRHDGENLYFMSSSNVRYWNEAKKLYGPTEPWELIQMGNCGSPLETEAGWILLTHGVGPLREYCIGALLLDREKPSQIIGRLREPLLAPASDEREGYVPNVVYSCGSMIHNDQLIIPYAMSDSRTAFASVSVSELLDALLASGS